MAVNESSGMEGLNDVSMYDIDEHVSELYDRQESGTDDVGLIRRLIADAGPLRVLEPLCGTGRILVPLVLDGHTGVGLDRSRVLLDRVRGKLRELPVDAQQRLGLVEPDVLAGDWPRPFDLVILGGNFLYELATPEEQELCIARASLSLKTGGYLYMDNDHMEGDLDPSWRRIGVQQSCFPSGVCADGTRISATIETVWFDRQLRLVRFNRTATIEQADGTVETREWTQQKHPPSTREMAGWLDKHGFAIQAFYGDRGGGPYTESSERAIFWAKKK